MASSRFLSQKQKLAIADVVVESAWLDVVLDMVIMEMTGIDQNTHDALFSGSDMIGRKLLIVRRLYELGKDSVPGSAAELLKDTIERAQCLNESRVKVVHGIWSRERDPSATGLLGNIDAPITHAIHRGTRINSETVLKLGEKIAAITNELINRSLPFWKNQQI